MKSEDNGDRLAAALVENDRLRSENERLRKLLRVREVCPQIISASEMEALSPATTPLAADEKIRLFRSLFRGREDIYAVRWEGKNGKAGYSPAHIKKGWFASKAEARANREFLPLTDAVIRDGGLVEIRSQEPTRLVFQQGINACRQFAAEVPERDRSR